MTPYYANNGHIPQDYHMHSDLSCDSDFTMAEMCQTALNRGILEIAFTEHYDLNPNDSCNTFYNPTRYFETLEAARREFGPQGLTIRAGVELGEFHCYRDTIQPVLETWPYDVVLGSLHWVGENLMFDPQYFRTHPAHEAVPAYFAELEMMVRGGGFDVLSHPDVIKRIAYEVYKGFDIAEWEDAVRPVWQACIESGIGIEINTAGLRLNVDETHPSLLALRWYRQMGGELLTIGSDSHRPQHVGFGLSRALDLARRAGFTRLCSYERRQVTRWIEI